MSILQATVNLLVQEHDKRSDKPLAVFFSHHRGNIPRPDLVVSLHK